MAVPLSRVGGGGGKGLAINKKKKNGIYSSSFFFKKYFYFRQLFNIWTYHVKVAGGYLYFKKSGSFSPIIRGENPTAIKKRIFLYVASLRYFTETCNFLSSSYFLH